MKVKAFLLLPLAVIVVNSCLPTNAVHINKGEENLERKGKVCNDPKNDCHECTTCCNKNWEALTYPNLGACVQDCVDNRPNCKTEDCLQLADCGKCEICCGTTSGSDSSSSSSSSESSEELEDEKTCFQRCEETLFLSACPSDCADSDSCIDCLDCCKYDVCNGISDPTTCPNLAPCVEACVKKNSVVPSAPTPCPEFACRYLQTCSSCTECCADFCSESSDPYCNDDCIYDCFFESRSFECTRNDCPALNICENQGDCCGEFCPTEECFEECMDDCTTP